MKFISVLILISFSLIKGQDYFDFHYLMLDDAQSTIDGARLGENDVFYEEDEDNFKSVTIKSPGTYYVAGRLNGQLRINLKKNEKITLILDGVYIYNSDYSAILFRKGYEFFNQTNGTISYEDARSLNFSDVGARIIIADDSVNNIIGSHSKNYDGAISSMFSLAISGESKGNGVLNIIGDLEGIEVKYHLLIEGGNINVFAQDDGINIYKKKLGVCLITGGKITVNSGFGSEGDGIDSNGYLIIEGGTVITASKPKTSSGLDSDLGTIIDGGNVFALGSPMDGAVSLGTQPAINLKFSSAILPNKVLKLFDTEKKEYFSFSASSLGFMEDTEVRNFTGATISLANLTLDKAYYLYLDEIQMGYGGVKEAKKTSSLFPTGNGTHTSHTRTNYTHTNHTNSNHSSHFTDLSGCDSLRNWNSTEFKLDSSAMTFSCVQETE